MAIPTEESNVEGKRDRHSYGQFRLTPGDAANVLKDSVICEVKLFVEINGRRDNEDFFGDMPGRASAVTR
jgi:hypothetical protein